jgi:hypothetical protein
MMKLKTKQIEGLITAGQLTMAIIDEWPEPQRSKARKIYRSIENSPNLTFVAGHVVEERAAAILYFVNSQRRAVWFSKKNGQVDAFGRLVLQDAFASQEGIW